MITDECIEWDGYLNRDGYGGVSVRNSTKRVHILAWEEAHGSIPVDPDPKKQLCVLHRCDNPPCFNIDHLFLGTRADNAADRDAKGRGCRPFGAFNPHASVTAAQVLEIRIASARGVPNAVLARQHGIHRRNIHNIVERKTWAHLGRLGE